MRYLKARVLVHTQTGLDVMGTKQVFREPSKISDFLLDFQRGKSGLNTELITDGQ